jgi:putative transposase
MYVDLVFVTKYRRCVLDGEAIEKLRQIFSNVCTDFEALLVQYPPKVSVSSLVNSLKGVSSYVLRRQLPRVAKCYWKNVLWVAFLLRRIIWRRTARRNQTLHRAASDTTIVAAYPDLNSGACATRWS